MRLNFARQLEAGDIRFMSKRSNSFENNDPESTANDTEKKVRRKTPEIPKITIVDDKNSISMCTMEQAVKIAERRKLRLVKIVDMDIRSKRPIYKLMSEAQYLEEDILEKKKQKDKKENNSLKGEKLLILSCRITDNDLKMKLNCADKWLRKNFEVRVTISGPNNALQETEKVYQEFENVFKEKAKFLQKRNKGGDIKFQLVPLEKASIDGDQKKPVGQKKKSKTTQVEKEDSEEEAEVSKSEESSEQNKHNILSKI